MSSLLIVSCDSRKPDPTTATVDTTSTSGTDLVPPENTTTPSGTDLVPPENTTVSPATTSLAQQEIDGAKLYIEATCDVCHGTSGEGRSGANLRVSTLDFNRVVKVIRFGVPGTQMKGWDFEPKPPGLTQAEIAAIADYVVTLRD